MTPLEQMLRETAAELAWPATPDLAAAWADAAPATAPSQRGRRARFPMRRPLAIALAALLLLAATAAAIPGIREPVLDWLGLRSVHVERVPRPLPEPPGQGLGLGDHSTLAKAVARIQFTPVFPTGLGKPTVYYDSFPPGGQLGLVYGGGRVFITEVQGKLERQYLFKFLQPGTGVEAIRVNGERGLWFKGQHQYAYADRDGELRTDSVRTAGNVLLWRRGDLLLRMEGARSKREALRIAHSVREGP
ncbi:MAG TPA: hypothetical protein VF066_03545 [Thermoleophilaceae bacterium]